MTVTVEDDFREFVTARWPDLEGVAFVVLLDAASARRVTTEAFATLHQGWHEALDDGRPGSLARRSVLRGAIAAATQGVRPGTPGSGPDPVGDDPVLTALQEVLLVATPHERALVAAASVWAAGPDEVADLLGMPAAQLRLLATALRSRLATAHDAARVAEGLGPAEWALDDDLDAVVERLLAGRGDPPDPTALVEDRRRAVRRRALVTGGAATLVAGAAGWWLRGRGPATSAGVPAAGASPVPLPSPDDPSWARVSRWAPRGRLATDARVQALVISRANGGGRLVWADDVEGRRVVVSATLNPGTEDVIVQVWHGAAGADPASLVEVPLQSPFVAGDQDAVAVAVAGSPGTLLLFLARPRTPQAAWSPTVTPTVQGTVRRDWIHVPLQSGVGSTVTTTEAGPALRVRCAGFDGPAVSPTQTWVGQGGTDALAGFAEETRRFVAAAIGEPAETLSTEVVTDAKVGGGVIDPRAISPQGGDGRVRVLSTSTRGGAVIRSVRVVDDGRSRANWLDLQPPTVLPARNAVDEPVVARLDDARPEVGRFLVVTPGAARVQLLSTSPNAYPVSKVTRTREGVAIVEVVNADDAAAFRLVQRDERGALLADGVPRNGTDLLDLWPTEQTLVS